MRKLILSSFVLVTVGCAPHEDPEFTKPPVKQVEAKPEPEPEPDPKPAPVPVDVVVASAQIMSDCPDEPTSADTAPAKGAVAPGKRAMPAPAEPEHAGDTPDDEFLPGAAPSQALSVCTQSWLQLSFTSRAEVPIDVKILKTTLIPSGLEQKKIPLQTRAPSVWDSTKGYLPWDETVQPGELKASYKLGAKDWSVVNREAQNGLYYEVEVEIDVGGEIRTLRSPTISKEIPENIVT